MIGKDYLCQYTAICVLLDLFNCYHFLAKYISFARQMSCQIINLGWGTQCCALFVFLLLEKYLLVLICQVHVMVNILVLRPQKHPSASISWGADWLGHSNDLVYGVLHHASLISVEY